MCLVRDGVRYHERLATVRQLALYRDDDDDENKSETREQLRSSCGLEAVLTQRRPLAQQLIDHSLAHTHTDGTITYCTLQSCRGLWAVASADNSRM